MKTHRRIEGMLLLIICFSFIAYLILIGLVADMNKEMRELKYNQTILQRELDSSMSKIKRLENKQNEIDNDQQNIKREFGLISKVNDITHLGIKNSAEIIKKCRIKDIPLPLMLAIYDKESSFNPYAKNKYSTATGLGQMLHSTAKFVASRSGESFRADRLTDARYNIRLSTYYLANDLYRYHKSWYVAVKYYGEGTNRYANSVMKKAGEYSKILNVPLI